MYDADAERDLQSLRLALQYCWRVGSRWVSLSEVRGLSTVGSVVSPPCTPCLALQVTTSGARGVNITAIFYSLRPWRFGVPNISHESQTKAKTLPLGWMSKLERSAIPKNADLSPSPQPA